MSVVTLRVEVLLFARLRELAGASSVAVSVGPAADGSGVTARSVWNAACAAHPRLAGSDAGLRVAVHPACASWGAGVGARDPGAFIPPLAPGSAAGRVHLGLTSAP